MDIIILGFWFIYWFYYWCYALRLRIKKKMRPNKEKEIKDKLFMGKAINAISCPEFEKLIKE